MKFQLEYRSGFGGWFVGWDATLFVGRRGSVTFHWSDASGQHDKSLRRYDFGLDAESFERLSNGLVALPEKMHEVDFDCGGSRSIRTVWEELDLARGSLYWAERANPAEQAFDRIWFELCALVQPSLLKLGIDDPDLLSAAQIRR